MKNQFNLFSEIYGCYFSVIEKIIEEAKGGITKKDIEILVQSQAFYDSAFHMMPKLFSQEWPFLEGEGGIYKTKQGLLPVKRPLTHLEKSWLKALLLDKRMVLFLEPSQLEIMEGLLKEVEPLFLPEHFHVFDSAQDGDPYESLTYQQYFALILKACNNRHLLKVTYESGKKQRLHKTILPYKMVYSNRDDKFRLIGLVLDKEGDYKKITLNLGRISQVGIMEKKVPQDLDMKGYLENEVKGEPIVLAISTERSGLERFLLQFASWEKETEYEEETDRYLCKLYYEKEDEAELLIRILSFGPVIKVLGHEAFLKQIKERIFCQYESLNFYTRKV